jgi:glycosyltransferase involved in cell wall biosynthesis
LLSGHTAFTAYEHGTLREIPFEDSSRGRACALAFREAPTVFVTNSDVMPSVAKLGIDPDRVVCLPHAFDSDKLLRFAAENSTLQPPTDGPPVLFAPARHDWVDGDPNFSKGNDVFLRALALVTDDGIPWRATLVAWGRDLEASQALAQELGIADRLEWVPPMPKRELWKRYLASHAVADQFVLPAIGGVAFEAMVLGRRLVTALDAEQNTAFFGEAPPVPDCRTPEDTAEALCAILLDPEDTTRTGDAIQRWFVRYHSASRIVGLQIDAYARLIAEDGFGRRHRIVPR